MLIHYSHSVYRERDLTTKTQEIIIQGQDLDLNRLDWPIQNLNLDSRTVQTLALSTIRDNRTRGHQEI